MAERGIGGSRHSGLRGVCVRHDDDVVPIASLTKMMTAYVALKKLPLGLGETGPCHVVTDDDVVTYQQLVGIDESERPR